MADRIKFTSNGIDYEYEADDAAIWVYDSVGMVASAEKDDISEALCFGYVDHEWGRMDCDGMIPDLYNKDWNEIAFWLVNTHPLI